MNIHSVISLIGGVSAVSHSCSTDAGEAERAFNKQKEGVTSWYRHQGGKTVLVRVANHDASNAQADAAAKKVKAAEAAKAAEAVASEKSAELVSAEAEAEAAAAKVVAVAEYEAAMARAEAAGVLPVVAVDLVEVPDGAIAGDAETAAAVKAVSETEKSAEKGDLPEVKSEEKTQEKTQEKPKGLGAAVKPGGKK